MTDYGVDVSHWNTVNDWNAVRGNGISFAQVKLTEGTDYVDPSFGGFVDGARNVGIKPGGYHYAHAGNVDAQVGAFIGQLNAKGLLAPGNLFPMLDLEADDLRGNATEFVSEWLATWRQRTGNCPIILYANLDWWTHVLDADALVGPGVVLQIARYNGDPGNPGWSHPGLALHQHSNAGTVPGIPGGVDRDCTMPGWSLGQLIIGGTTATPPPPPAPAPTPVPVPPPGRTYTVRPGDTLSGIGARFGISWRTLQQVNGIRDANRIYAGQVLRIPGVSARSYRVQAGDTLSGIASRNGCTWQQLQQLNNLKNPNLIYPGEVLQLP